MTLSEIGSVADPHDGFSTSPLLRIDSVSKRFGAVQALSDVSLDCHAGEIHAVLGENGSGKSTLFGIVSGVLTPDSGTVAIAGSRVHAGHPAEALERGLAMAYQTYSLVPELSIAHNLLLSARPARRPRRFAEAVEWAAHELDRLDVRIDPRIRVGELRLAERQFLEVVKALVSRPRLLLLDEPTTALGLEEVGRMHDLVSHAVGDGLGVLYVSHRLNEVLPLADRLTILRDGERVGTIAAGAVTESDVVALMIGRPVELAFPQRIDVPGTTAPRLEARGLLGERFGPVDLTVRPGEIVGLAGAEGNGQDRLLRALAGLEAVSAGQMLIDGEEAAPRTPAAALGRGVMLISGERARESLFPVLGVRPNATIGILPRLARLGFVPRRGECAAAVDVVRQLNVRTPSIEEPVRFLSGGNQQKVVLARPILGNVRILLIEEPTQGVDIRSRFEIYEAMRARAKQGMSIVIRSADAIELAGVCDRVVVVSRGEIVNELVGEELTEDRIVERILRAKPRSAPSPGDATAVAGARRASAARERPWIPAVSLAALSLVIGLFTWLRSDAFLTEFNINSLLLLTVPLALAAMGQLHALVLGEFDVSIGALMGLTVVCASFLVTEPSWAWVLLGSAGLLAIACAVGTLNVVLIRLVAIPSIIATIATFSVLQGVTLMLRPTPGGLISTTLGSGLTARWGFLPYSLVGVVALALALDAWLYRTRDGLATRAVGFDETSSTRSGVPTRSRYVRALLLSSVFAGAGGLFLAALVGIGDPRVGTSFTLPALAAAVLGGAALGGGRGSFIGAVVGALFLTLLINVLPFLGWSAAWGDVARGAVTLGALAIFKARAIWRALGRRSSRGAFTER